MNLTQQIHEATKQKLSERFKGELNPFYGKTHTEESRRLISEARMGTKHPLYAKSPEFLYHQNKDKAGVNTVTLTNIHTKETFSFGTVVEAASFRSSMQSRYHLQGYLVNTTSDHSSK